MPVERRRSGSRKVKRPSWGSRKGSKRGSKRRSKRRSRPKPKTIQKENPKPIDDQDTSTDFLTVDI